MTKSDEDFVDSVRRWRNNEQKPVAYMSGKILHQFHDMTEGFIPLYIGKPSPIKIKPKEVV